MKEQYYQIRLNDYASAAFVSSYKNYYGTIGEIGELIKAVDDKELTAVYKAFIAGNSGVEHNVAYSSCKFLESVEFVDSYDLELHDLKWQHSIPGIMCIICDARRLNSR